MSPSEGPDTFGAMDLDPQIVAAVEALGFEHPTPIQAAAIPVMLEGHDIIGRARTGSGKTAAFGLPLLHAVREGGSPPRALVMTPTRELALQVTEAIRSFAKQLPLRIATVYGGAPYPPQIRALQTATVVVGTPGRLLDHLQRGTLKLDAVKHFVLDEADEMLRMGFIEDVQTLLQATAAERQIALFSATMPREIQRIAQEHQRDPVEVQVEDTALAVDHIRQEWMRVPQRYKLDALQRVLQGRPHGAVLVFARTRAGCADVADALITRGVAVDALHGDLSQSARERVLQRLRAGRLSVVVATDVAARGIDVDHITHVINFDLPSDTETYVHRIGRTGRVGRDGVAITFATPAQKKYVRQLARELKVDIEPVEVPSDAAIATQRQSALATRIIEATTRLPEHPEADAWLTALLEEHDVTAAQVAAAAVQLLAKSADTPLGTPENDEAPAWARPVRRDGPRDSASSGPYGENTNEVQLFLPVGRQRDVRPGDIVGALANEGGIDGRRIGRVTILDRKTFVGVPKAVADELLNTLERVQIRGHDVPVSVARPGTAPSGRPPRRRGPPRGGSGKPRPRKPRPSRDGQERRERRD